MLLVEWALLGRTCLVMAQLLATQRRCITVGAAAVNLSCAHNATMSASTHSSATDVDAGASNDAPQVEALFLIRFDKKVGYVERAPSWRTQC
jgi:hypothetical protein